MIRAETMEVIGEFAETEFRSGTFTEAFDKKTADRARASERS